MLREFTKHLVELFAFVFWIATVMGFALVIFAMFY